MDLTTENEGCCEGRNHKSLPRKSSPKVRSTQEVKPENVLIGDWSHSGRGEHVEFDKDEEVPLPQGRLLGRGAMGDVYEVAINGWKIAHKRVFFHKKIGKEEISEISILKKISHVHMLQLVGTYTQQRCMGLLLHPVAVCDLKTFFDDVTAWFKVQSSEMTLDDFAEDGHKARLDALAYDFPEAKSAHKASKIYFKIGCLISAVAYLHNLRIRHKDLKPSNILLSRDGLWLGDFGSATDFSMLSHSPTDNERGTPRYLAPEVVKWIPNGRAADIFSLGCVLLEILVVHDRGSLKHIKQNIHGDPAFHANLDKLDIWLDSPHERNSPRRCQLICEIKQMLSTEPSRRPRIDDICTRLAMVDMCRPDACAPSLFSTCCRKSMTRFEEQDEVIKDLTNEMDQLRTNHQAEIQRLTNKIDKLQVSHIEEVKTLEKHHSASKKALTAEHVAIVSELESANATATSKLREAHLSEFLSITMQHRNAMTNFRDTHESAITAIRTEYDQIILALTQEQEELRDELVSLETENQHVSTRLADLQAQLLVGSTKFRAITAVEVAQETRFMQHMLIDPVHLESGIENDPMHTMLELAEPSRSVIFDMSNPKGHPEYERDLVDRWLFNMINSSTLQKAQLRAMDLFTTLSTEDYWATISETWFQDEILEHHYRLYEESYNSCPSISLEGLSEASDRTPKTATMSHAEKESDITATQSWTDPPEIPWRLDGKPELTLPPSPSLILPPALISRLDDLSIPPSPPPVLRTHRAVLPLADPRPFLQSASPVLLPPPPPPPPSYLQPLTTHSPLPDAPYLLDSTTSPISSPSIQHFRLQPRRPNTARSI